MRRLRIVSKSYGIEQYDVTVDDWDNMVKGFRNALRDIPDLYLQEQFVNQEAYQRGDYSSIVHWENISQYCT